MRFFSLCEMRPITFLTEYYVEVIGQSSSQVMVPESIRNRFYVSRESRQHAAPKIQRNVSAEIGVGVSTNLIARGGFCSKKDQC